MHGRTEWTAVELFGSASAYCSMFSHVAVPLCGYSARLSIRDLVHVLEMPTVSKMATINAWVLLRCTKCCCDVPR
jgi:hypothetical protein